MKKNVISIILTSLVAAIILSYISQTDKLPIYSNPEEELNYRVSNQKLRELIQKNVEEDERRKKLEVLETLINIAYDSYSTTPLVKGSELEKYIINKVNEFNSVAAGSGSYIVFDGDTPELSISTVYSHIIVD